MSGSDVFFLAVLAAIVAVPLYNFATEVVAWFERRMPLERWQCCARLDKSPSGFEVVIPSRSTTDEQFPTLTQQGGKL